MQLDVSSFKSVRAFGAAWEKRGSPVHVLINNAGIFSMSAPRTETCDGFESHIGTNYLGHFLLTILLQPSLIEAGRQMKNPARVVNVSSRLSLMGRINMDDPNMKKHFSSLEAYAQSKLAQVIFAKEFTNRMRGAIRCISLHPGEVLTDVVRSLPPIMQKMYKWFMSIFLLTPSQGRSQTSASHMQYLVCSI
jgi:NAD(P)-dependent dehydrogenase (short-subunit alcohol dehydrogenase family)